MPKNASLFGKYLRLGCGPGHLKGFKKKQIIPPIPVKAYGRPPSAASQTGLYHDEDFNYHTKVSFSLRKHRRKLKPNVFRKSIESLELNTVLENVRVTTSAMHSMDDCGGFDGYIQETTPEQLRSVLGERMKTVMNFYQTSHPMIQNWALPWKVFNSLRHQKDPFFALLNHLTGKQLNTESLKNSRAVHSPYYLPMSIERLYPMRQTFKQPSVHFDQNAGQFGNKISTNINSAANYLDTSWRSQPAILKALKEQSQSAVNQFKRHACHREMIHSHNGAFLNENGAETEAQSAVKLDALTKASLSTFRTGNNRGGGGQSGVSLRKRSKTHKYFEIRRY